MSRKLLILFLLLVILINTIVFIPKINRKETFDNLFFEDNNTLINSNKLIIKLLKKNKPFIITRLGIGTETNMCYHYLKHNKLDDTQRYGLANNAGIYNTTKNDDCIKRYCELYAKAIEKSAALAVWNTDLNNMKVKQDYFVDKYKIDTISAMVLEPFYSIDKNIDVWSHYLKDKTVLVIHPFVDSFQKQFKNNFTFYEQNDKYIWHPKQKFIYYKTYNTAAGNNLHRDWEETYNLMCEDIKKLDFDVALLGCGGYGHPLCNFIYEEMNKSAIYIGGALQILFGVIGKRWEDNKEVSDILKKNKTLPKMIRASHNEVLKNNKKIEEGCYW